MAALTVQTSNRAAGIDNVAGLQAVSASDTFPADNNTYIRIKNGNAAACTVTVNPPAGGGKSGTTIAPFALGPVAATTGDREFGPFPLDPFGDPATGLVTLTYSVTATVSIQVKKMTG